MAKKSILAISFLAILMLSILIVPNAPVKAWEYQDGTPSDTKFEKFGPRADKLLIKLYSTAEAEWAGLEAGQIDITDWPLDQAHYNLYTTPPWSNTINVLGYGAEFGLYLFDMNQNNNTLLGNDANGWTTTANPVYPNPMGYSVSESGILQDNGWALRAAIIHCVDRDAIVSFIGTATAVPCFSLLPPCYGKYSNPDINAANDWVKYDSGLASLILNNSGLFPYDPVTTWRYWDRNRNGHHDLGEDFNLKLFGRVDDPNRLNAAQLLDAQLSLANPCVRIPHTLITGDISAARIQVMANKDFHIYTGGWSLGTTPDSIILWNWDFYWHPGRPYDYAGCNKDVFNEASYGVMYANDQEDAVYWALIAQDYFAEAAMGAPMYSVSGYKAMSRLYTGGNKWTPVSPDDGENAYRGQYWEGAVSVGGYGVDSDWSFMNMHPRGFERGEGNMTIRWGFLTAKIPSFNPIYATTTDPSDGTISEPIEVLYEPLLRRNPYNLAEFMPWLVEDFEVGTYTHPIYGTCSKVKFTLRPDATWSDGTPLTTADVYFTLVELDDILKARGLPPPSWKNNVMDILDFRITDPYNFEVLFDVKSIFAISWIAEIPILPMHIWKPICESGDPTSFAPDPNLIGSGPWRFVEYVENSHISMIANRPGSTVTTNLPGSVPVTSPKGYWRYIPVIGHLTIDGATMVKIDYYTPHTAVYRLVNEWYGGPITIDVNLTVLLHNGTIVETNTTRVELKAKGTEGDCSQLACCIFGWIDWFFHFHIDLPSEREDYSIQCYATITPDIVGSTLYDDIGLPGYPYKSQLPSPDFKVDMINDIRTAAKAFGSYPGHERWNTVADINGDYSIDILNDIRGIAKRFGWVG